jgi:hypothetical protein
LLHAGNYTSIDVPAALNTQAIGINDQGDVSGIYLRYKRHALLLDAPSVSPGSGSRGSGSTPTVRDGLDVR